MASEAIQALARRAESSRAALARIRENTKLQGERAMVVGETAVAALAAGFVDGYWGTPTMFGLPAVPVIGVLMALGGLSGWVPGGQHIAALGVGAVAGPLYVKAFQKGAEKKTAP